ncbi:hypothetical protein RND81_09G047800 [Saponaria officinalis]|uniref:Uncharacterized protein n=1 Tax=Saponaria officinalis TaxID=3572 RepID=A0AAW1IGU8_SAPOF
MAQGYVEPLEESLGMEDVADQYFLELFRRNFFQYVKEYDTCDVIRCKMHDLVHDLAQHVAGAESIVVEGSRAQFTNRLVHANFCAGAKLIEVPQSLLPARNLRSLLLIGSNSTTATFKELILKFGSLRALESSSIEIVPDSIGRLRHLRHLNLSGSLIEFLPSGITRLDNLKTLDVNYCRKLKELPRGLTKLTSLRLLGIRECPFADIPPNFGRLKSLRELNRFIVGQNNGFDTLADLNLRGRLGIEFRTWRINAVLEAQVANLKEKKQLSSLSFCFQYDGEQAAIDARDEELLNSLQLPPNLKDLHFSGVTGSSFPRRMDLSLKELKALEYVEADDFRDTDRESSSPVFFPALESLALVSMDELKRWSKVEHVDNLHLGKYYVFPRLRRLNISGCHKLMTLPSMPELQSLNTYNIRGELLASILTSSSSTPRLKYLNLNLKSTELTSLSLRNQYMIRRLSIKDCGSLRNIPDGMQRFSYLEDLKIYGCEDLDSWNISAWQRLKSLRTLFISDMSNLQVLPQGITCLTTLQHLSIACLRNLTALPEYINGMSQLSSLSILHCPKLTAIPQSFLGLTSLQSLMIFDCPDLEKRCQQPAGQDWPLIRHIPQVRIRCCP